MTRRGFTLVELVMVAAILAVISAIAMPRYAGSMATFRARTAARRLAADIAMAQAQARASSSTRQIEFTSAGYTVKGIAGLDGRASYTVDFSEDPYKSALTPALTDDALTLTFDGYGAADRGGTIQITSGGSTRTLTIQPATGAVSVD